jgi:phosphoglycolate phosphatase-like HAD superfamily hydrolase
VQARWSRRAVLRAGGALALAPAVLGGTAREGLAASQGKVPLPSWREGAVKQRILDFVEAVTTTGSARYVPPAARIATFDNDGTLWCEQPLYVQGFFVIDRARALASQDPALADRDPYKAILANGREAMAEFGEKEIADLVATTSTGMTPEEFLQVAAAWFANARHPRFGRLFIDLTYQPQLELLAYLQANGFTTFIVSGGGVDFMRALPDSVYGIPRERIVGSSAKTRFEQREGRAVLVKLPELGSDDDKEGKPININLHIGRRPLLAFGNSDGDLQMLQYTASGDGARLMLLVHHDDAEREYAYDRDSAVGRLDQALDEARARDWAVVSMRDDWATIFPATETARG